MAAVKALQKRALAVERADAQPEVKVVTSSQLRRLKLKSRSRWYAGPQ